MKNPFASEQSLMYNTLNGPFMQAELYSLTGLGKLRVTCNWLYSALNVDPQDGSPFLWEFSREAENLISISPTSSCIEHKIYASVRDDNQNFLQVQAPFSADWITAIGRDELITMNVQDLNLGTFKGFNNSYIRLDDSVTSHDNHNGYRLRSVGAEIDNNSVWYLKIQRGLQSNLELKEQDYTIERVRTQLQTAGIKINEDILEKLVGQLNS
ncbi:hypothetical protein [uncultured Algoriphagus sp.]|uniref:hypothetical protein n=1 Tax=uncultured Algoriphagus sp. TaxID=417365 RepID=UPI0030EEED8B|tara:strand:- start:7273 stop:7908 length:636 start_codon:yes stop_codon:yes gene_type:complete